MIFAVFGLAFLLSHEAKAAPQNEAQVELLRNEISRVENELLSSKDQNLSAANQLKKMKKLIELQKREIRLSELRTNDLSRSLRSLSDQKQNLIDSISAQKKILGARLRELAKLTEYEALDATWIENIDQISQREAYLTKIAKKDVELVARLKRNADDALALELKIIEEKSQLEYYVQELKEQNAMMAANEQVQKEIITSNRSSRLETLKNLRELKLAEKELTGMIQKLEKKTPKGTGLAGFKGRLPMPLEGKILSTFGRSYNQKTNLFTFQKGITIESKNGLDAKASSDGKVVFAGPLKHYGQLVIVEHSGQYYTLYGQLAQASVKEGDDVRQGDAVGKTSNEPFYFEIRNKNIAINPLQWLQGGVALGKLSSRTEGSKN